MAFFAIQLSDIHFSTRKDSNPLLERDKDLFSSIRGELSRGDQCLLVLSGDIADCGNLAEYDIAENFIEALMVDLTNHLGNTPQIVLIPGNHDFDFSHEEYDQQLRETIIDSATPSNPPSSKMDDILFKPQEAFRNFADNLYKKHEACISKGLYCNHCIELGDNNVSLYILNSTRFTKIREEAGKSWFPVEKLSQFMSKSVSPEDTIVMSVIHHPYQWYHPDNASKLKGVLEEFCDVIFTGHEHQSGHYLKKYKSNEQNLYIEGGVLQEHETPQTSTYNIVRLDTERKIFCCKSMVWNGKIYKAINEESEHRYLRLRQEARNNFDLTADLQNWLEQVGTDFRHPRSHELKLSDFFVYPDLRKLNVKRACKPSGLVRDREVLGYIQEKRRVLIAGHEKIGKTSFCKSLFTDLREAGLVPLILRSEFIVTNQKKETISDCIKSAIVKIIEKTYVPSSAVCFWHTPIENRVIIIDDYDQLSLSLDGRDHLLKWCGENFGIVIVTADPGIRMREILNRTIDDTILWTFEHVDILEADRETRDSLISQWLVLGTDPFEVSQDELYKDRVRYAHMIDALIGQGAIPSVPLFILMMMQQIETHGAIENSTGLYGALYELIIKDVVKVGCSKLSDIEVRLNYLSEFAFFLYLTKKINIDYATFQKWHIDYCDEYNLMLNEQTLVKQLCHIGVFRHKNDYIGFKYRYYYCFFLARYLSLHIHESEIIDEIQTLSKILYNTDVANTMLFLCHLSKNPKIIQLILKTAKDHFVGEEKYDLSKAPKVLPEGKIIPASLTLTHSSPVEERKKNLRKQDDFAPPRGLNQPSMDEEKELELEEETIKLVNEMNSAGHVIRICGQIVRNFYGGIRGEIQIDIIRESYNLCLRMISVMYKLLERDKEAIAGVLAKILKQRYPDLSIDAVDKRTRESLQFFAMNICYSFIKHTSNSISLVDLKPSFDKIIKMKDISLSERVLDLSTRFDCFDKFPLKSLIEMTSKLNKSGGVGYEVLRILAWEHMKLFIVPLEIRQSVCDRLKIEINPTELATKKDKR